MIYPTIHLNGTSRETLLAEYRTAHERLSDAIDALRHVTVHGRDYYPQGSVAMSEAFDEHQQRLIGLEKVRDELEDIYLKIEGCA